MLHPFNDILLICTNVANEMKVFEKYGFFSLLDSNFN